MKAALGFREHTGWAIAVGVAGEAGNPAVVLRERVALLDVSLPRQAYHAVAEQGAERGVIELVRENARVLSSGAVAELKRRIEAEGYTVEAMAVSRRRTAVPGSLDRILAAHTLLHAAEGELYRDALCEAAAANGLGLTRFDAREVIAEAALAAGAPLAVFAERLARLGAAMGPPWQKDHREAAAAACVALALR